MIVYRLLLVGAGIGALTLTGLCVTTAAALAYEWHRDRPDLRTMWTQLRDIRAILLTAPPLFTTSGALIYTTAALAPARIEAPPTPEPAEVQEVWSQ